MKLFLLEIKLYFIYLLDLNLPLEFS